MTTATLQTRKPTAERQGRTPSLRVQGWSRSFCSAVRDAGTAPQKQAFWATQACRLPCDPIALLF